MFCVIAHNFYMIHDREAVFFTLITHLIRVEQKDRCNQVTEPWVREKRRVTAAFIGNGC